MNIAILVPVTSRNQYYKDINDIPFFNKLYPSFQTTKCKEHTYDFFIGYDDDDEFYNNNAELFGPNFNVIKLSECQHAPAKAWNKLATVAYNDKNKVYNYFFQIGDDVVLETPGWTSHFIEKLKKNQNIGVVGPCNLENYNGRISWGKPFVIENSFVHRNHLDIFGYFFHPEITNWYCDDWISRIYDNHFSEIQLNFTCTNTVQGSRYLISDIRSEIDKLVLESTKKLNPKRVFSYCIYGTQAKYCLGMIKNLEQIKELFPEYETWIIIGNDVPQSYIDKYISYKNVKLIHTNINTGRLMAYRLFPLDNPLVELMFTRDADSRFSERDIWCMNEFIKSDYRVCTIRDHWWQQSQIQMGQSGFKRLEGIDIQNWHSEFCRKYNNIDGYSNDQNFANEYIYNRYFNDLLVFSEYAQFSGENICKIDVNRANEFDFCGNVRLFKEDDMTEYWEFDINGKC